MNEDKQPKKKRRRKRRASIYKLIYPRGRQAFYKNRCGRFLTPAHLRALGRVTAEWGILETVLNLYGNGLLKTQFSLLTGGASAERQSELLIAMVALTLQSHPKRAARLVTELKKIKALATERNYLAHAGWGDVLTIRGWGRGPRSAQAYTLRFVGRGKTADWKPFTAAAIDDLAKRIGDVRIDICKTFAPLPFPLGPRASRKQWATYLAADERRKAARKAAETRRNARRT